VTGRRRSRLRALLASVLVAVGCAHFRHAPPPPPSAPSAGAVAASEWPLARSAAQQAAIGGRFERADSVLRAFAASYPGTEASAEALFFRAFYKLDPAIETSAAPEATREARLALDAYIAGGALQPHYAEALTLRRIAAHLDSLHTNVLEAVRPTVLGTSGVRDTLKLRDDEITRLRAELEQTRSEMDRLRRRLTPRP